MSAKNIVDRVPDLVKVRRVMMSCSDKSNLLQLLIGLFQHCPGVEVISTGRTLEKIRDLIEINHLTGGSVVSVEDITGHPPMQGGLVKTLDWRFFLGMLAEAFNPKHIDDLKNTSAKRIQGLFFNFYPFAEKIVEAGITFEEARSELDIGGPGNARASGKSFHTVAGVTDPADYEEFVNMLARTGGCTTLEFRYAMMQKIFVLTAEYDAAIRDYLANMSYEKMVSCYTVDEDVFDPEGEVKNG